MSHGQSSDAVMLPLACTLDPSDGHRRIERWRSLWAQGQPTVQREDEKLVITFAPDPGVREELETLAAAERRCCAFARWEVVQDPDHAILRVTSNAQGLAAIAMMFKLESAQDAVGRLATTLVLSDRTLEGADAPAPPC